MSESDKVEYFKIKKMSIKKLERLLSEKGSPCVSISLNTHKTHPANEQDNIVLRNLLNEAKERVISEFGKRPVNDLLDKFEGIANEIDKNYNLNSLHIFLSNSTKEIIRSPWPIAHNSVSIADSFDAKPLIKIFNRLQEYLILLLSQSGVNLYLAVNDTITSEAKNEDFPFSQNPHYITHSDKLSDAKQVDNMVREFLNKVDKAVWRVNNETNLKCVVICTEDNYIRLFQVADKPDIYLGHVLIDYNNTAPHKIVADAWQLVSQLQKQVRTNAINEMQEAVGQGKVYTDLSEIFRAAKEGRGDLLICHEDFKQPAKISGDFSFELVDDVTIPGVTDDITSEIAREVISKNGRVVFTNQDEIKSIGNIALKVRY